MNSHILKTWTVFVTLASLAGIACAQAPATTSAPASAPATSPADSLGPKYIDVQNGFALRMPPGVERQRQSGSAALVRFVQRGLKDAIEWTITVQQATEPEKIDNLKAYSGKVLDRLKVESAEKEDVTLGTVAGKDAFDIRGQHVLGKATVWQRQVWIQRKPQEFLILIITGPKGNKAQLEDMMSSVLKTVELIDPETYKKQREANLKAGAEFLKSLTAEKIAAAIRTETAWSLIKYKGKNTGFSYTNQSKTKQDDADGFETVTVNYSSLGKMKVAAFSATARLNDEKTLYDADYDSGKGRIELKKSGAQLAWKAIGEGSEKSGTSDVPNEGYLTTLTQELLPRLINLKKNASYSFLSYSLAKQLFQTVTFAVEGPANINKNGKTIPCIHATLQLSVTEEPGDMYLDDAGNILLYVIPNGTIEPATQEEVIKAFPKAKDLIKD